MGISNGRVCFICFNEYKGSAFDNLQSVALFIKTKIWHMLAKELKKSDVTTYLMITFFVIVNMHVLTNHT